MIIARYSHISNMICQLSSLNSFIYWWKYTYTYYLIKSISISLLNTPDCVKSLLVKSVCMQLHNVKRWIQRSNQIMYIVFKGKKKKEKNSYLNIWSKMSPINSLKAMEKSNNARNRKWFSFRLSVCDLRILFFNISHR